MAPSHQPGAPAADPDVPLHRLHAGAVAERLGVNPRRGLSDAEAVERLTHYGPNELPEARRDPAWRRLLAQLRELLTLVLLGAAAVSFAVSGELKTPLVVLAVVVLNSVIGFVQESRAEASLDALRSMVVTRARVRRGGELRTVPTAELVPGDVVAVEAGDRIPADGRLLQAVQFEVDESALTGESVSVAKHAEVIDVAELAVGDRRNLVHMSSTVTRGRGELVVTGTGLATEIGQIARLLRSAEPERTPLQRQLDGLAGNLAVLAGVVVAAVVAIGLLRGQDISSLLVTAVALAVASVPEGLPAVTAVTLAIGVSKMARQHAIVKRLAGVETLGCTSVICSDKTGTLTLNQMTARAVVAEGRRHGITGEGYDPAGWIEPAEDGRPFELTEALEPMALCVDASIRRGGGGSWEVIGDPTEGAVVVLAAKGGIDVEALRSQRPRLAEVPFDSAARYMASIHPPVDRPTGVTARLFAKGAPDVLIARASHAVGPGGAIVPIAEARAGLEDANAALAAEGLRVLAVAARDVPAEQWADVEAGGGPAALVHDLTLLALVGIVDPPREEARLAIAEARAAGIDVVMITGDHASTASAVGRDLGLPPAGSDVVAVTGVELDAMDDHELRDRIADIDVFARVAPEHKIRLVSALQSQGHVVAMTGDGVNDAPALKQADIGIAMGLTGTEVTKEAATMVLTDDDFATIVAAVRQGRAIYDNIVKFVRFQLSTTLGFAIVFLLAATSGVADGKPFTAIAILWVNLIMDGPPAMALGLDPGSADTMRRRPRPRSERILTRSRWVAVASAAAIMAVGTLAVLVLAPGPVPRGGTASVAGTMAFTTFVLFQMANLLNVRSDSRSVFDRETLTNRWLWLALAGVLALQILVVHLAPLQRLFDTMSITAAQWAVCAAVASSILWVEEAAKLLRRRRSRSSVPGRLH